MACRRAVVAPRRPALQEVVTDGQDGLLFTPGDEMDLARNLGRLLDDPTLRERIAEAGYDRVRARHPASAARRRLLEAYARLLPPSQWAPPASAVSPIDALPSRSDTTTSQRPLPTTVPLDGRATGEKSGEIHLGTPTPDQPVVAGEIVIDEIVIEMEAPLPGEDLLREVLEEAFTAEENVSAEEKDDRDTGKFVAITSPLGFDDDDSDDKTKQRPLRPKKTSG
jgi:hypothetical protein